MKPKITIIGAGISGLTTAVYLHQKGFEIQILEATERAGGRIKTDIVNGFRLDRGFQVLLTEYPETKALLDYKKLNLKPFLPGAKVLYDGGIFEIADPFRRPSALLSTIFAPVGTLKDKMNTFFLKNKLVKRSVSAIFNQPETTTLHKLKEYGFSKKMIERFYQPFFAGIFLENKLSTSSNMFDFVMKMFSQGNAALPALGMEEIPKQLVSKLPENSIIYNCKVLNIDNNKIYCENGQFYETDTIIIATEATSFASNYVLKSKQAYNQVTNVYFEAQKVPLNKALVVLNASSNKKWVDNLTVMTNISKEYASSDKVLIAVSCNGIPEIEDVILAQNMKNELQTWFGKEVLEWNMIQAYRIKYALPNQESVRNEVPNSEIQINDNLFICGDHLLNGSINAAMKSGRLVAELIASKAEKN
jgi:protoporphyrinogen oxidase